MSLGSKELEATVNLIRESLRVTSAQKPVFEDVRGLLPQIRSKTHHVVYGRRGSGKSSLLLSVHWERKDNDEVSWYVDAQLYSMRPYDNLIISICLDVLRSMMTRVQSYLDGHCRGVRSVKKIWDLRYRKAKQVRDSLDKLIGELTTELDRPEEYPVEEVDEERFEAEKGSGFEVKVDTNGAGAAVKTKKQTTAEVTKGEKRSLIREKGGFIESKLSEIGDILDQSLDALGKDEAFLEIDDFYYVRRDDQPRVIDYLFRLVKQRHIYLKVATAKHRTRLIGNVNGQEIGMQSGADFQPIELDRTLEDKSSLSSLLFNILNGLAKRAGTNDASLDELLTNGARDLLVDASGGVPRDFLAIFLRAWEISHYERDDSKIKKRDVGEAARRHLEETKSQHFSEDASGDSSQLEEALSTIREWVLQKAKSTVFLVDKQEYSDYPMAHEAIQALVGIRFLHMIVADTSASYGGGRRYEAYLVDPGIWASPRRHNIKEVAYDQRDNGGRRDELRNAPVFPLERLQNIFKRNSTSE